MNRFIHAAVLIGAEMHSQFVRLLTKMSIQRHFTRRIRNRPVSTTAERTGRVGTANSAQEN